jgi:hypothetical protein
MARRATLIIEDDVYDYLLARAGSPRKLSEALNPLVRSAIDLERTWHETQPGIWKRTEVHPWGLVTGEIADLPTAGTGGDPAVVLPYPYMVRQEVKWTDPRLSAMPAPTVVAVTDTFPNAQALYDQWVTDAATTYAALAQAAHSA